MTDQKLTPLEIGAILAIVVIWGVNNAAAKLATEYMPPLMVAGLRFAIAAVCLLPFVRPPFPNWKAMLTIAFLGGAVHYGLVYYAFSLAQDVSPVSVATQMWIPFTSMFAFLLLGERLKWPAVVGMIIAFIGVAWMTADPHALHDWEAIVFGILAAAVWALVTVIARRTTKVPPLKMQGILALTALPTMALGSFVFETGQLEGLKAAPPLVWASIVWAGLLSSVMATSLLFWLVQRREAGRVTPYLLGSTVVSVLMGWLFMDDLLTGQIVVGAALTLVGVIVVSLAERNLRVGAAR
ncbi:MULTISPECIES: DMT family transporter [Brevundimonas]|uniref:DMT family transporter n=1 Tax=Brevundimonas pishanensis TaxID=2896315 RepID=UPI001FA72691|nr:EamA family transporter [Brevundimonas pishanensis]